MAEYRPMSEAEISAIEEAPEEGAQPLEPLTVVELFECTTCHENKPYGEFYEEKRTAASGATYMARRTQCKKCFLGARVGKRKRPSKPAGQRNGRVTTKSKSGSSGYNRQKIESKTGYHLDGLMINKLRRWGDRLWAENIKFIDDFNDATMSQLQQIIPEDGIKIIRQAFSKNDTDILDHVFRYDRPFLGLTTKEAVASVALDGLTKAAQILEQIAAEPTPIEEPFETVPIYEPAPINPIKPPPPPPNTLTPVSITSDDDIEALARMITEAGDRVDELEKAVRVAQEALDAAHMQLGAAIEERRRAIDMFRERM